ncbi:uncharacterized protein [Euphorbia lathyris]|uniref:uncharacterized protein n=1 Tax=Euphorbia lathyris TaxID=212925 RepID=UPI003313A79F
MEGKQLDFNRPLLSVRRFSPTVSKAETENKRKTEKAFPRVPPVYKSELRSGPVRNPGTVPFVWEQSPGRPKYETKPQTFDPQHAPAAPRLPPGRPGRSLNADSHRQAFEATAVSHSETKSDLLGSQSAPLLDKNETEEISGDGTEETDVLGSEDDHEAYVDALEALSRSESFFLNCSVSGVSGLDGPDIKQWGTSSTDQQTRDFMMGRFLPAAKAMASETPQYSTRKQPVPQEQPRTASKLLTMEKRHPFNEGRRLTNVPHCPHCNGEEETEEEDGMRKQIQAPMLSSNMTKVRSSHAVYCPENGNEHNQDDIHKQASIHVLQTKGMQNEQKSQSNKIHCRSYEKELDGSSLYKRLQGNVPLPYKDKFSIPTITEEKGFLGIPEKSKDSVANSCVNGGKVFREFLTSESDEWESASSSPLVEKTLYIDSEHMLKPQVSNSSSSDMKGINEHRRDDVTRNGEVEETTSTYSSFQEDELGTAARDKENMLSKSLESANSGLISLSDRSMHDIKMVSMNSKHNQDLTDISTSEESLKVDPLNMQSKKVGDDVDSNLEKQLLHMKLSDEEISKGCSVQKSQLPLPLPLPKSPSESWLKRALPAVSTKHTASRSSLGLNLHPRVEASKIESPDSKWETIVKTAKVQHGHLRYSEELLSTIPEV